MSDDERGVCNPEQSGSDRKAEAKRACLDEGLCEQLTARERREWTAFPGEMWRRFCLLLQVNYMFL